MSGAALWPVGLPSGDGKAQPVSRLDRQCIIWLEVLSDAARDAEDDYVTRHNRARCPYEAACRERGSCFLPQRPRC
jgi:hypothetical protein